MTRNEIPVLLLTGYLGSGKTTLLNRILSNRRGIRFAVIVNDIGEVNIDASLIQKGGVVGQADAGDLVALQNGCICCTLQMDLVKQLVDIASSQRFDYIVIEASGICEPEPIARSIAAIPQMDPAGSLPVLPRLDCIVTVVDALRLRSEFGCGGDLKRSDLGEEDIENLIIQQIEFCNMILLNKVSEVTADEAEQIKAVVRALQPKAAIAECDYADIDFDRILHTGRFDYEDVATSAAWVKELEREVTDEEEAEAHGHHHHHHHHHDEDHHHDEHCHDEHCHDEHCHDEHCHCHHHHHHGEGEAEEYGIQTMVYYRRAGFDLSRFDRYVAQRWPRNIIRAKGMLYFTHNRDMCYLFEQAGVQKKLSEAGLWCATAPEADLKIMMERDPNLARDWDPEYGDRMIKIVIIGRDLDRRAIAADLDTCLG